MNKAIISGNLGRDPETRYTQSGSTVVNFSIASTETVKGEKKTEWHKVVAFGKTAELVGQYLSKGSKALIEGKIQTRSWEKDGETKYSTEILANSVEFLDSKPKQQEQPQQSQPHVDGSSMDDDDPDVPF